METGRREELAVFGHKPAYFADFRQNEPSAERPRKPRKDPGAGVAIPTPAAAHFGLAALLTSLQSPSSGSFLRRQRASSTDAYSRSPRNVYFNRIRTSLRRNGPGVHGGS
jgi:hypothetical protein